MKAAVLHGARDLRIEPHRQPELRAGMVLLHPRRVGICGTDLHYYEHGHNATFVPDRPFILGHELTAEVAGIADDVERLKIGQRVTVNPARSCGFCSYCKNGRINLCRKLIMLGSASTTPPTDGALADFVTVRADQCHALPAEMDDGIGAMMEPLSVALHALKRAGTVSGKSVLVIGGGTIGLLVAISARAFGAVPVAVSDPVAARRHKALELGVDVALDPAARDFRDQAGALTGDGFDTIFEASGSPRALRAAFDLARPGGTMVQIGTLGGDDIPIPVNEIMVREINFVGSMRYGDMFDQAIRLVAAGRVNVQPFVNDVFALDDAVKAMQFAADKTLSLKVQIQP
jgi:L-idonate 5-dehydrogenase